jgi:hypothetical protein
MKALFWIGLILIVAGIVSLVMPIPHTQNNGVKIGDASIGVQTRHSEKVSPIISAVLILGGAGMMIAGRRSS